MEGDYRKLTTTRHDQSEPLIQCDIKWMTNHLMQPASIDDLANAMHVSYRTLNRRFIEITGLTPLAYLQALKIERAKELPDGTAQRFRGDHIECGLRGRFIVQ